MAQGKSGVQPVERNGFPRDTNAAVNALIDLADRNWIVKFKTDSLDYKGEFIEDAEKVTLLLPRSAGGAGSATNPYVMGTNSSTHNELDEWDDTWDITDPQIVDGVKTDGVRAGGALPPANTTVYPTFIRYGHDTSASGSRSLALDGGGSVTLRIEVYRIFIRAVTFDNAGKLIFVGAEQGIDLNLSYSVFE